MSLTRLNIAFISPDTSGFNSVLRYSTAQSQFVWDSSAYAFPANHQGTVSGYTSGGASSPSSYVNTVDKFPFSANGNATDVGDLSQTREQLAGQSSTTNGYTSGGFTTVAVNTVDKFPFSVDGNASDVGDLTQARSASAGQSSATRGYTSGGGSSGTIDKFTFASNANATDVGDLTVYRSAATGQNSNTSGYTSGGLSSPGPGVNFNVVDKFPFASDSNASDVGDLTVIRYYVAGQSSTTSGYTSGGYTNFPGPGTRNIIDKFPFATDGNATDVGDLTQARVGSAGQSSTASGYTSGGSPPFVNTIDKFPFSSNGNATDVGDLTQVRRYAAGQQI
jgi:hypothetical protein